MTSLTTAISNRLKTKKMIKILFILKTVIFLLCEIDVKMLLELLQIIERFIHVICPLVIATISVITFIKQFKKEKPKPEFHF